MPSLKKRGRSSCVRTGETVPRIVFLPASFAPDGEPRIGVQLPGCRLPILFPSIAAANAAIEARRAAR